MYLFMTTNKTIYSIWDSLRENVMFRNGSRLNHYNVQTVNAITPHFQRIILHLSSTCILYLQRHTADVTRYDTPGGSKPSPLQVGAFKSLQFGVYVEGTCIYTDSFCSFISHGDTEVRS